MPSWDGISRRQKGILIRFIGIITVVAIIVIVATEGIAARNIFCVHTLRSKFLDRPDFSQATEVKNVEQLNRTCFTSRGAHEQKVYEGYLARQTSARHDCMGPNCPINGGISRVQGIRDFSNIESVDLELRHIKWRKNTWDWRRYGVSGLG